MPRQKERRRRDSNPRYDFSYAGFQDQCIKPALPLLRFAKVNIFTLEGATKVNDVYEKNKGIIEKKVTKYGA